MSLHPKKANTLARNAAIRAEFKTEKLKNILKTEKIIADLARKWFLEERTIEDIVYRK